MQLRKLIVILLCFLIFRSAFSQFIDRFDTPYILNYNKQIYGAENQNWSIAQDNLGNMFFGNSAGLVKYDGQSWETFYLQNGGIVRSIAIDSENRIFIGSYEEFGFWKTNEKGNMIYTSLSRLLSDYSFHDEEIWKIIILDKKVYFQAFTKIFVYDGKDISIINPSGVISCFSKINDNLFVHIGDKGLFRLKETSLELIDNIFFLRQNSIREILPYMPNKYLVASYENGIFIYDEITDKVKPWNSQYQSFLREKKINRAIITQDKKYIFGTILDGLFIFDAQGNFIQQVNQGNGLQNNTVLSLYNDLNNQLWAGLDNGIDNLFMNSKLTFFWDKNTKLGAVYAVIFHNNLFYVGTNRGLYYSELINDPGTGISTFDFKLIENSQDQVWYLKEVDGELFCGHNKGTFKVTGNKLKEIADINGGLSMVKFSKANKDYLLQGTYTDLVLYKRNNNKWVYSQNIDSFQHPIKYIEVDHLNNIWAAHFLKGLYKIVLNDSLTQVVSAKLMPSQNGFDHGKRVQVIKFRNRVLFLNNGTIFTYNDFNDSLIKFDLFMDDKNIAPWKEKIIPVNDKNCWLLSKQALILYHFTDSIPKVIDIYPFKLFQNGFIEKFESIYPFQNDKSVVCLNEGLALVNNRLTPDSNYLRDVHITRVEADGNKLFQLEINQNNNQWPVLNYNQNTISFRFTCPVYNTETKFKVRLNGLDTNWMELKSNTIKFERLPYNNYSFEVFAEDNFGNTSPVTQWKFSIRPPFYLSIIAYLVYFILFVAFIYITQKYYKKRLKTQELSLIREKEKALIKLRNDQLRSEIQQKTEQLADTTFAIIKKNELLMQIKGLLLHNRKSQTENSKQIIDSLRLIERNISHGDDWKIFENNFEQAHREFLRRIKEQYPDLSPNDLRMCAFLRMNLSSKKIGSLLGISTRSVENHRYRIRKKLKLEHDSSLTDYIISF